MKKAFLTLPLLTVSLSIAFYACDQKPFKSPKELAKLKADSLAVVKLKNDSIALSDITIKSAIQIGDKRVT